MCTFYLFKKSFRLHEWPIPLKESREQGQHGLPVVCPGLGAVLCPSAQHCFQVRLLIIQWNVNTLMGCDLAFLREIEHITFKTTFVMYIFSSPFPTSTQLQEYYAHNAFIIQINNNNILFLKYKICRWLPDIFFEFSNTLLQRINLRISLTH